MNTIPPIDLTRHQEPIRAEIEEAMRRVFASGAYIGGAQVNAFEEDFARYIGTEHCVSCNSGTDALVLSLRALGIGVGDEVIVTSFSFIATSEAVVLSGAKPVFVDIAAQSFSLDPEQLVDAITSKTRAILPVHLFGSPAAMTQIMAIAEDYNLYVIEDCAQSTGGQWRGKKLGSMGTAGCFSFFPTKNLGACGDGGAITTNNAQLAAKARALKAHGSYERYRHESTGINSRLDALQAAILQIKLRFLDRWNCQRQDLAAHYRNLLVNYPGIELPASKPEPVWNQYTIRVKQGSESRAKLREKLAEQGVGSMVYYPIPLHLQPTYLQDGYIPPSLPQSELAAQEVLSLPMFPGLTEAEQVQVAKALYAGLTTLANLRTNCHP